ncbi:hypothetical protein Pelo_700 [Pelomyxa schiedti]|nr:hypothetical protein Pelo_700 [Pelomyxa schiedti]
MQQFVLAVQDCGRGETFTDGPAVVYALSFAVSPVMRQITHGITVERYRGNCIWIAPHMFVNVTYRLGTLCETSWFLVSPHSRSEFRDRMITTRLRCSAFDVNRKWMVVSEWAGDMGNAEVLTIFSIDECARVPEGSSADKIGVIVPVPLSEPLSQVHRGYLFLSKAADCCDECVLLIINGYDVAFIMLIDLAKTVHSGGVMSVTASTKTQFFWRDYVFSSAVAVRKNDGTIEFFFSQRPSGSCGMGEDEYTGFSVDSVTGEAKVVAGNRSGMSVVSNSLMCMSQSETKAFELWDCNDTTKPLKSETKAFELWDCNDTTKPLKVMAQPVGDCGSPVGCRQIVGARGFLFGVTENHNVISVIEPLSGSIIATHAMSFLDTAIILPKESLL